MKLLLQELANLRGSDLSKSVLERMDYFSREMSEDEIFYELCFCLMAANFTLTVARKPIPSGMGGIATLPLLRK